MWFYYRCVAKQFEGNMMLRDMWQHLVLSILVGELNG